MTASSDPSMRFVLTDGDAPYLKNLAALWASEPKLAWAIEALDDSKSPYHVEPSRSGLPTMKAQSDDGRSLYIHSRYEPADEAAKLIDSVNTKEVVAFYVQGFGLGYHIEN